MDLRTEFGGIDIYLFDQLLRRQIRPGDRIVDVGCGHGRNLVYLLRAGYDVSALDPDPAAIDETRALAARLAPDLPAANFRQERAELNTFPDGFADVAISSAVLHFAMDVREFDAMLEGTWRLLAPGGLLFCRLASTIGVEAEVRAVDAAARRFALPDGTGRFLVDEPMLLERTAALGGHLVDPLKTTVVGRLRAMTTWVVRRNRPAA